MNNNLISRLGVCYTGVVHDVMRAAGHENFTLPKTIRPIMEDKVLAGPIFTISGAVDKNADEHQTLLEWTGLLSKAKPGHVWVSQPNDNEVSHMGELSAETLQMKGVLGVITDGAIRDVNFLLDLGFQAWCKGYTPRDVVGRWLPDGFDVEIKIGEVIINPGDWCIGDRDGMIIIPKQHVEEVICQSEEAMAKENLVRKAILNNVDPQEAYIRYGKF
jgi:4-hydroxy-4-methyl-2-oxoglutarate aldolase